MKFFRWQINIIPVISLGLAAGAVSVSATDMKFSIPVDDGKLAFLSAAPNMCVAEVVEKNPHPFLFVGCGIE